MATYVYMCENSECVNPETGENYVFERVQRMSDKHEAWCDKCGQQAKKLITPPAISFKGSGFHVNDYPSRL